MHALGLLAVVLLLMPMACPAQVVQLIPSSINFGTVPPCEWRLDSFELANTTTDVLAPLNSFDFRGYRFSFADSISNIEPGQRRRMYVRFIGDASRPVWNTILQIQFVRSDGTMIPTTELRLSGSRDQGPCLTLRLPILDVKAGTAVAIGLFQEKESRDVNVEGVEVTFEISWDPTLLVPGPFTFPPIASGEHRATFRAPLRADDGNLFELPFTATLGNKRTAPIVLEWFSLSNPSIPANGSGGRITIQDVCADPADRLFDGTTSVDQGFAVYDLAGRQLNTVYAKSVREVAALACSHGIRGAVFVVHVVTGVAQTYVLP